LFFRFLSGGELVDEVLNGSIGFFIGDLDFGRGLGAACGCAPVMEQAVGQRAADVLVEEGEEGRHTDSFQDKAIGIALAYAFEQAVAFQLAQVITELIQGVGLGGNREGT